ncbi:unnamed protein product [Ambrosiozyma monospora]|uniref:Unnamed protein product n=1 Tax=Ambrosiozyma monospora TaxID=43982 RepID=A0A9W6T525_AMBMO|nr:unnamed protein product [Ambrosiozyma monospora]
MYLSLTLSMTLTLSLGLRLRLRLRLRLGKIMVMIQGINISDINQMILHHRQRQLIRRIIRNDINIIIQIITHHLTFSPKPSTSSSPYTTKQTPITPTPTPIAIAIPTLALPLSILSIVRRQRRMQLLLMSQHQVSSSKTSATSGTLERFLIRM